VNYKKGGYFPRKSLEKADEKALKALEKADKSYHKQVVQAIKSMDALVTSIDRNENGNKDDAQEEQE
jgi:hypothetical protein